MLESKKMLVLTALLFLFENLLFVKLNGAKPVLAADGVNYQESIMNLNEQGIFSSYPGLFFQPSGYPITIWTLTLFGLLPLYPTYFLFQSAFHVLAAATLRNALLNSKWKRIANFVFCFLLFNPTLIMCSFNLGYESFSASLFSLFVAICLKLNGGKKANEQIRQLGILIGIMTFFNIRFVVLSILILILLKKLKHQSTKGSIKSSLIIFGVGIIVPLMLLSMRNLIAVQVKKPSTNLGVTLNWGAGYSATGAHNIFGKFGVPCQDLVGPSVIMGESEIRKLFFNITSTNTPVAIARNDSILRNCVLDWYFKNPKELARLSTLKVRWYMSPITGPFSEGTLSINNELLDKANSAIDKLHRGNLKILIEALYLGWSCIILSLTIAGLLRVLRFYSMLGLALGLALFSQLVVSSLSLGDNRFRVPTIPVIIFLALVPFYDKTLAKRNN